MKAGARAGVASASWCSVSSISCSVCGASSAPTNRCSAAKRSRCTSGRARSARIPRTPPRTASTVMTSMPDVAISAYSGAAVPKRRWIGSHSTGHTATHTAPSRAFVASDIDRRSTSHATAYTGGHQHQRDLQRDAREAFGCLAMAGGRVDEQRQQARRDDPRERMHDDAVQQRAPREQREVVAARGALRLLPGRVRCGRHRHASSSTTNHAACGCATRRWRWLNRWPRRRRTSARPACSPGGEPDSPIRLRMRSRNPPSCICRARLTSSRPSASAPCLMAFLEQRRREEGGHGLARVALQREADRRGRRGAREREATVRLQETPLGSSRVEIVALALGEVAHHRRQVGHQRRQVVGPRERHCVQRVEHVEQGVRRQLHAQQALLGLRAQLRRARELAARAQAAQRRTRRQRHGDGGDMIELRAADAAEKAQPRLHRLHRRAPGQSQREDQREALPKRTCKAVRDEERHVDGHAERERRRQDVPYRLGRRHALLQGMQVGAGDDGHAERPEQALRGDAPAQRRPRRGGASARDGRAVVRERFAGHRRWIIQIRQGRRRRGERIHVESQCRAAARQRRWLDDERPIQPHDRQRARTVPRVKSARSPSAARAPTTQGEFMPVHSTRPPATRAGSSAVALLLGMLAACGGGATTGAAQSPAVQAASVQAPIVQASSGTAGLARAVLPDGDAVGDAAVARRRPGRFRLGPGRRCGRAAGRQLLGALDRLRHCPNDW